MADITYCASDCPFRDCERHKSKISDAAIRGKEYISVSDFAPTCRRYIAHVVGKVATNADLIDRQALLEHIKDVPTWSQVLGEGYRPNKYPAGMYDPGDIISSVENAPSIDAVPVRRGTGLADRRIFRGLPDSGGIYPAVGGEVFKAASDPDQLRAGNR